MRARTVLGLLVVLCTASCIPLGGRTVYASKPVMEKQGTNLLVAGDRSTCVVSEAVFNRVAPGDRHRCVWNESDPNSTRIRPGMPPTPRRQPAAVPMRD
ncbi:hypothetical protein [Gemmatimonas sp.]|uniref:hypothetical protein n=1 Tax=Gemmatimonas sp. TaxID=1962908 RepID=UPI00286C7F12|nr:hypothetical protein [Gemmatimonas sp.]